ncbi:MAG: hypothetical protein ACYC2K_00690 [Gemmatimonadales bacterium]
MLTPALKLGHVGRWLRWVLATGTYLAVGMSGVILLVALTTKSERTAESQEGSGLTAFLVAVGITAVLVGSIVTWFTREPKRNLPTPLTARQIVRQAVGQDVRALSSAGTDEARAALVAIHARVPSTEYVAHLERVRERIEGMTAEVDRAAKAQAVAIVQRGLRAAQRSRQERSRTHAA